MAMTLNRHIELSLDAAALKDIEDLKKKLGSDNLSTTVYSAVAIVKQLYEYQGRGYEIVVRKGGRGTAIVKAGR